MTKAPTIRTATKVRIPLPNRLRVGKYDVEAPAKPESPKIIVMSEWATKPPREPIHVQTAMQGLTEYGTQKHKIWMSWNGRQRIAFIAILVQLIWPLWIYATVNQSPYEVASSVEIAIYFAMAMYVPVMVALGCAWLFFKPANY